MREILYASGPPRVFHSSRSVCKLSHTSFALNHLHGCVITDYTCTNNKPNTRPRARGQNGDPSSSRLPKLKLWRQRQQDGSDADPDRYRAIHACFWVRPLSLAARSLARSRPPLLFLPLCNALQIGPIDDTHSGGRRGERYANCIEGDRRETSSDPSQ